MFKLLSPQRNILSHSLGPDSGYAEKRCKITDLFWVGKYLVMFFRIYDVRFFKLEIFECRLLPMVVKTEFVKINSHLIQINSELISTKWELILGMSKGGIRLFKFGIRNTGVVSTH